MKPDTLQKSWRKLWPEVMIESEQTGNEQDTDTPEIVNDLQTLQHDIQANDVDEWIAKCDEDCETNEELNDDQIVAAVSQVDEETVNEEPDDEDEPPASVSHTEAKKAFDVLQYIEQLSLIHI